MIDYAKFKNEVERINNRNKQQFEKVPVSDRLLFISHCIVKDQMKKIRTLAERLGYKFYKVGGGSIVLKKIREEQPGAVVGVACYREIEMAVKEIDIPLQAVMLESDGCRETTVNLKEVENILLSGVGVKPGGKKRHRKKTEDSKP